MTNGDAVREILANSGSGLAPTDEQIIAFMAAINEVAFNNEMNCQQAHDDMVWGEEYYPIPKE